MTCCYHKPLIDPYFLTIAEIFHFVKSHGDLSFKFLDRVFGWKAIKYISGQTLTGCEIDSLLYDNGLPYNIFQILLLTLVS